MIVGSKNGRLRASSQEPVRSPLLSFASFCDALLESKNEINIFLPEVLPTRDPALLPVIEHYNKLLGYYKLVRHQ